MIAVDEVEKVQADPFMQGARVALLCGGMLHVSPAMFDALEAETEAAWRSLRVLRVPSAEALAAAKAVTLAPEAGEVLECPKYLTRIHRLQENNR